MSTNGHFRRTFGFGRKQSYHTRCTFGFGMMQLVNTVVAKSTVQSLSCGGRECARRKESLASLCTDWLCKNNRGNQLRCLRLHLVHVACGPRQAGINDALGLGPDTIDFRLRFRFSAESKTRFRSTSTLILYILSASFTIVNTVACIAKIWTLVPPLTVDTTRLNILVHFSVSNGYFSRVCVWSVPWRINVQIRSYTGVDRWSGRSVTPSIDGRSSCRSLAAK